MPAGRHTETGCALVVRLRFFDVSRDAPGLFQVERVKHPVFFITESTCTPRKLLQNPATIL